ncbi:MAG: peptidylprolyl isomerase [Kiritimatiellae bacterium]|nr:peptidylprolyl isomerase [Kiritimatiellia bacterium]
MKINQPSAPLRCGSVAAIAAVCLSGAATTNPPAVPSALIPDDLFERPAPSAVAPTTVVAIVEGRTITQRDVDRLVERALAMHGRQIPPDRRDEARRQLAVQAREELIVQTLLEAEAERQKIPVSDEELAKLKASITLPPGQTLEQALAAQNVTMEQFDADLRQELRKRALLEKNVPKPEVTDAEVRAFYESQPDVFRLPETVTARHILIAVPPDAPAADRAKKREQAEKVRAELLAGGDFAELAKKYSDDPGSRDRGGLYEFPRGRMVPPFEEAAFTQKIGEIGPIVETQFGYHIIQTTNRSPERTVSFEEAAPRIRQHLERTKWNRAVADYIRGLQARANIVRPGAAPVAPAAPQR